jgi:benzoyl-CoA-dihydrodiol lyase
VVDKRHVRRDLADVFSTRAEGIKGAQALQWGLVDAIAPRSTFDAVVREAADRRAATSDRPQAESGIALTPLDRVVTPEGFRYPNVRVAIDRESGAATITIQGPTGPQPTTGPELAAAGSSAWILAAARELDDALLRLRTNEPEIGTLIIRSEGDVAGVVEAEAILADGPACGSNHWLTREVSLYWTRTLKRLDLSARTIVALVEPASCFGGVLAEIVLAADRSYMLSGPREDHPDEGEALMVLSAANLGRHRMSNGLSRLETRFYGRSAALSKCETMLGKEMLAAGAFEVELVTFIPDDIDFDDDVRLAIEERNSFSPDALTGLEANLRFVGPETMETKIFGRLTAWQNWIFQRPNAVGPEGALKRFGSGSRANFDRSRV